MKFLSLIMILITVNTNANVGSGSHGADLVLCRESKDNHLNGVYILDYVLNYNPMNHNSDIPQDLNWEKQKIRMRDLLSLYAPQYLIDSFNEWAID